MGIKVKNKKKDPTLSDKIMVEVYKSFIQKELTELASYIIQLIDTKISSDIDLLDKNLTKVEKEQIKTMIDMYIIKELVDRSGKDKEQQ